LLYRIIKDDTRKSLEKYRNQTEFGDLEVLCDQCRDFKELEQKGLTKDLRMSQSRRRDIKEDNDEECSDLYEQHMWVLPRSKEIS
jgi:hypothetical protein